ncbi:MAG TPA: cytochrome c oxidase assembly protein, partial [Gemmatimonadaceae bacterium]|nr:cytochrome c oxidase assembly protein [Gemmatimonadaceae bacterium]
EGRAIAPHDLWSAWTWSLPIVLPLAATLVLYALGVRTLWARAGRGRGVRRWEAGAFALGWLSLVVALVSPLHALGEALFSAHMVQHELLMTIAAPLLVLGRPVVPALFALSPPWRRRVTGWTASVPFQRVWTAVARPLAAWALHAIAIWGWHVPGLYEATLDNAFLHALQHLSFLGTALLFWWTVLHPAWSARGVAMISLFTTMLHTGALGAIIAVSPTLWFPAYAATTLPWGLTPLDDQQLGGMIMWIPGGAAYLVAALALLASSLRESERRARPWGEDLGLEAGWRAS